MLIDFGVNVAVFLNEKLKNIFGSHKIQIINFQYNKCL